MLLNCVVGEDSWESLGLQEDPTSPSWRKSVLNIHWKDWLETPILWPPDAKNWVIWKDPDAGKDWGQEEKGTTEDEIVWWHHRLNGHEFGWTMRVGDGQGGLACCCSWHRRVQHDWVTELNWTDVQNCLSGVYRADWFHFQFWISRKDLLDNLCPMKHQVTLETMSESWIVIHSLLMVLFCVETMTS